MFHHSPRGQRAAAAPGSNHTHRESQNGRGWKGSLWKRRQMPVRKSAASTPSEKPLALLPEPSGSRTAAALEKTSRLQCNSCLAFGGFVAVDCLHQVPRVHASSPRCPVRRRAWPCSAYRDGFLGNLQFPLLPLWEVIKHAELIRLLPTCLFNPFTRHVAKAPQHRTRSAHEEMPGNPASGWAAAPRSAGKAGNCPAESKGAAFLRCRHIWRSGRGRKKVGEQKKGREIPESTRVSQPKYRSGTDDALKVARF